MGWYVPAEHDLDRDRRKHFWAWAPSPTFSTPVGASAGRLDLDRLERLTLRVIAKAYFRLAPDDEEPES